MAFKLLAAADRQFLSSFRRRTLPFEQWTHKAHLNLAFASHLETNLDRDQTWNHVRRDIQLYNELHAARLTVGYHATMTYCWVQLTSYSTELFVSNRHGRSDSLEFAAFYEFAQDLHRSDAWRQYYSQDLMFSAPAKATCHEPDLIKLP
eukprot:m.17231 g.17231  ORF g.17231 m.17231 type:complete len:149 (+) comp10660_c0_seq1:195-641(+)